MAKEPPTPTPTPEAEKPKDNTPKEKPTSSETSIATTKDQTTFYDLAQKHGTDKTSTHSYHHMYTKYLEPLRSKHLKFMEIGLGCNMDYGPGASYKLWLEYFPNVELYFIEYDSGCVEKWKDATPGATVFVGDQANATFLAEVVEGTGGDFDVIVDDGGHTMTQQITSFTTLFPSLQSNGLYFIEDLQTSYMEGFGGNSDTTTTGSKDTTTTTQFLYGAIDQIMRNDRKGVFEHVVGVDCMKEVCCVTMDNGEGEPAYPFNSHVEAMQKT